MVEQKTVIITGANGSLGISIGKRFINECSEDIRLRIVVTSRNFRGVTDAVKTLQEYVLKNHKNRKELVEFDYLLFDQTDMVSMLGAAQEIKKRYEHVDYIFFNTSFTQFERIDYWQAWLDFLKGPIYAFTVGTFKRQGLPKMSPDGMSCAFEANVFAPWYLVQEILPVLSGGSRLIWISSSISLPQYFDVNDIAIEKTENSYEASKYIMELLHRATFKNLLEQHNIQSWIIQPGVFRSTGPIFAGLNILSFIGMYIMFYICQWFGSPYHTISSDIAASAPLFVSLEADPKKNDMTVKYGSSTDRLGNEVLMESPFNPPQEHVDAVYNYIENLLTEWRAKLKNQVIDRVNY